MTDHVDELLRERSVDVEARRVHEARIEASAELVAKLGHDFNNLLTSILGTLGLLAEEARAGADTTRSAEFIDDALSAGREGVDLLDKLRACTCRQALQPERVETSALLRELGTLVRTTLPGEVRLELRVTDDVSAVPADRRRLENALLALVVNAREAMPEGGTLRFEARNLRLRPDEAERLHGLTSGEHVVFTVADSGTGIDEETAARIYEPFFTTRRPGRGRGFGLSTAYGFARQSGGRLAVDSEPGTGTTARLVLPASD